MSQGRWVDIACLRAREPQDIHYRYQRDADRASARASISCVSFLNVESLFYVEMTAPTHQRRRARAVMGRSKGRCRQRLGSSPSPLTDAIAASCSASVSSVSGNRLGRREANSVLPQRDYRSTTDGAHRQRPLPTRAVHAPARARQPDPAAATASCPRAPRAATGAGCPTRRSIPAACAPHAHPRARPTQPLRHSRRHHRDAPGFSGRDRRRQRAGYRPQLAGQAKLTQELVLQQRLRIDLATGRQNAQRDGGRNARLPWASRRAPVQRDAPLRKVEARAEQGGAHALARFAHAGLGQSDNLGGRQAAREVHFHPHQRGIDPARARLWTSAGLMCGFLQRDA